MAPAASASSAVHHSHRQALTRACRCASSSSAPVAEGCNRFRSAPSTSHSRAGVARARRARDRSRAAVRYMFTYTTSGNWGEGGIVSYVGGPADDRPTHGMRDVKTPPVFRTLAQHWVPSLSIDALSARPSPT